MENCEVEKLDPEMEFLLSKHETGIEWELFKENVRPLKKGRNIAILNEALKSHTSNVLKNSLFHERRNMVEAINDYAGDDPLHPWLECIKWVRQTFPSGGDSSGLVVIYEQCLRTFWHSDSYKDDIRYLKVWMEYDWQAQTCSDAEIVYSFLDTNEIGKTHAAYYISYAMHMESKNKLKMANDIYNLGISRTAQPIETLKDACRNFFMRSMRRPKAIDDLVDKNLSLRSFGTVLFREEIRMRTTDISSEKLKQDRDHTSLVNIYKDPSVIDTTLHHLPHVSKTNIASWQTLGSGAERMKENKAKPCKWKAYKVPQKSGSIAERSNGCIEIFVDEECQKEKPKNDAESSTKISNLQLRQGNDQHLKTERELSRKTQSCNFPSNNLPR